MWKTTENGPQLLKHIFWITWLSTALVLKSFQSFLFPGFYMLYVKVDWKRSLVWLSECKPNINKWLKDWLLFLFFVLTWNLKINSLWRNPVLLAHLMGEMSAKSRVLWLASNRLWNAQHTSVTTGWCLFTVNSGNRKLFESQTVVTSVMFYCSAFTFVRGFQKKDTDR